MTQQLACTYAALMLHESGSISSGDILAVTKAAGLTVSPGMATAFADAVSSISLDCLMQSIIFAGGASAAAGASPSGAAAAAAPAAGGAAADAGKAKKDEPEEEEDDDMGFGLFD